MKFQLEYSILLGDSTFLKKEEIGKRGVDFLKGGCIRPSRKLPLNRNSNK